MRSCFLDSFNEIGVDSAISNIIDEGRELDDIRRIVPHAYNDAVMTMKQEIVSYIKDHDKIQYPIERYFDDNKE